MERRLLALGARPLRAGMDPAQWLTEAPDDVHAVRPRRRGCPHYAMLTTRGARRHVQLRLPTHRYGRPSFTAGTINDLATAGITGLRYPKQVDTAR